MGAVGNLVTVFDLRDRFTRASQKVLMIRKAKIGISFVNLKTSAEFEDNAVLTAFLNNLIIQEKIKDVIIGQILKFNSNRTYAK